MCYRDILYFKFFLLLKSTVAVVTWLTHIYLEIVKFQYKIKNLSKLFEECLLSFQMFLGCSVLSTQLTQQLWYHVF